MRVIGPARGKAIECADPITLTLDASRLDLSGSSAGACLYAPAGEVICHLNAGLRFSLKALTPSRRSSVGTMRL